MFSLDEGMCVCVNDMKSLGMRSDSDEAGPQIDDLRFDRRQPTEADVAVADIAARFVGRSRTKCVHIRLDYCKYIADFNEGLHVEYAVICLYCEQNRIKNYNKQTN